MELPIINKLKRESQRKTAELQDEIIEIIYEIENDSVMHGGTCIWRCYAGKRFSEDIDLYCDYGTNFRERLEKHVESRQLKIIRFRETENSLFSAISNGETEVELEITREKKKGHLTVYRKADGGCTDVLALSPQELIIEKMEAFRDRNKIRDLYDVYFLSKLVSDKKIKEEIKKYLKDIRKPQDAADLDALVYEGTVPKFKDMVESLMIWVDQST